MQIVKVVFHASGENAGTYDPLCYLQTFTGDLSEKVDRFVSWDCNIPVSVDRYHVREIAIPDWMDERQYLTDHVRLTYALALGMPDNFTATQYTNFCKLPERYRYFIGWLYGKQKLTKFDASIKSQVEQWLIDPAPKYATPLTAAQFQAASKYCQTWRGSTISHALYYNR